MICLLHGIEYYLKLSQVSKVCPILFVSTVKQVREPVYRHPAREKVLGARPCFCITRPVPKPFAELSLFVVFIKAAAVVAVLKLEGWDV